MDIVLLGIEVVGKVGMGMQCWNRNGWEWEWEWFDGSAKGMGTRKSLPHTSSPNLALGSYITRW